MSGSHYYRLVSSTFLEVDESELSLSEVEKQGGMLIIQPCTIHRMRFTMCPDQVSLDFEPEYDLAITRASTIVSVLDTSL